MRKVFLLMALVSFFGVILAGNFFACSENQYDADAVGEGIINAIGPELVDSTGETTSSDVLVDKDYLVLYFSAEWCPPCRQFTPKLVNFYDEYAEKGNLEVIFISADRSVSEMYEYMEAYDMKWLAVPYDRRDQSGLAQKYGLRGIPRLVAVDAGENVVIDSEMDGPVEMLDELAGMF